MSNPFIIGDVVECVDDSDSLGDLTAGKQYTVCYSNGDYVKLTESRAIWYYHRFSYVHSASADLGPQRFSPSSPERVEAQSRDAKRQIEQSRQAPPAGTKPRFELIGCCDGSWAVVDNELKRFAPAQYRIDAEQLLEQFESGDLEAGWVPQIVISKPDHGTPLADTPPAGPQPSLALDVSLEKARALHRVWRALNDGDCPSCHHFHAATEIVRNQTGIECPACGFYITHGEIEDIEKMFAPAMDAAVNIFLEWRKNFADKSSKSSEPPASEPSPAQPAPPVPSARFYVDRFKDQWACLDLSKSRYVLRKYEGEARVVLAECLRGNTEEWNWSSFTVIDKSWLDGMREILLMIQKERERQVLGHGYSCQRDDAYRTGELARAAACYAFGRQIMYHNGWISHHGHGDEPRLTRMWPWEDVSWKPSPNDRIKELVKAGALIVAEIERLRRQQKTQGSKNEQTVGNNGRTIPVSGRAAHDDF